MIYITVMDYAAGDIRIFKHDFSPKTWGNIDNADVQKWLEDEGEYSEDTCSFMFSNFMPGIWNKTGEEL